MYQLHDDNTVRFNDRVVGSIHNNGGLWDGTMDGAVVCLAPSREVAFDRLVNAATMGWRS